jgi:nucleotide sugar dehydrogenase
MDADPAALKRSLSDGDAEIGIWGNGFIGFSTMANFANNGFACRGYDIDADLVDTINDGEVPIDTLEYWLGFDTEPLVDEGLMRATTDPTELQDPSVRVHFVAVPTEKEGEPWAGPLEDVVSKIVEIPASSSEPLVVIIESTLTPGMTEDVVFPIVEASDLELGEELLLGVAPRRDWFTSKDKHLVDIPRVFGGQNETATEHVESVLQEVCKNLVAASDHAHAEIVKSVENAYRHIGIALANQLSRSYPDTDMREVLELAATKWNIPAYFPSVGIGGYCIPVASKYVLSGATNESELSLLQETIKTDQEQPLLVADSLVDRGVDTVTILGLAYKGDIKVDILSPTKQIASRLLDQGVDVKVNDPYFDDEYISRVTGAEGVSFPEGLSGSDAVVLVADHRRYSYVQNDRILGTLDEGSLVIDNSRLWEDIPFEDAGVEYYYTGADGWLGGATTAGKEADPQLTKG